jgi:hypothetical protein
MDEWYTEDEPYVFDYNKASQWHMIVSRDGITPLPFPPFESTEEDQSVHH